MTQKDAGVPILVAGSGRGGTTWIGDTVASCSRCCSVFEPMQPEYVTEVPRWGRECGLPGPYLRPEANDPRWKAFFDQVFNGSLSNVWTRQDWRIAEGLSRWKPADRITYRIARMCYHLRKLRAERYVVKEIRANLMLDWLDGHFPVRIVFVTRHPCAVIGSRLRVGWEANLGEIVTQADLMQDHLEPYREWIFAARTPLQRAAVLWCVENLVPLKQRNRRNWVFCSYEECLVDPPGAFDRIIRQLELKKTRATERVPGILVSTPGPEAGRVRPWHSPLSEHEGEEVLDICARFGLGLYGRSVLPLAEAIGAAHRESRTYQTALAPPCQ